MVLGYSGCCSVVRGFCGVMDERLPLDCEVSCSLGEEEHVSCGEVGEGVEDGGAG